MVQPHGARRVVATAGTEPRSARGARHGTESLEGIAAAGSGFGPLRDAYNTGEVASEKILNSRPHSGDDIDVGAKAEAYTCFYPRSG